LEEGTEGLRKDESVIDLSPARDAGLRFIGRIRTPWATREECPRQGDLQGPECRVDLDEVWAPALAGLQEYDRIELLYWLHLSRRDVVIQNPAHDGMTFGAFALRSPLRPNPIATSMVGLVRIEGSRLIVRGLDCVDGTPLLDIKPDRCAFSPKARRRAEASPL
jgi:tRNA-Thr(GGU) m(6)t(6)A37 methyltransferase TsaA